MKIFQTAFLALALAVAAICQVRAPAVPTDEARKAGMTHLGTLRLPDQFTAQYFAGIDTATSFAYFGSSPLKIDLNGKAPKLVPGESQETIGALAIPADISDRDPLKHYLYAAGGSRILKLAPGDPAHPPHAIATLELAAGRTGMGAALDISSADLTQHYAYFIVQGKDGRFRVLRMRLSDFSEQGAQIIDRDTPVDPNAPLGPTLPKGIAVDTVHHYLYVLYGNNRPPMLRLCKMNLQNFRDGGGCVATQDLAQTTPGDGVARAGFDLPNFDPIGKMLIDSVHGYAYMGSFTVLLSGDESKLDTWPYNQSIVVRVKLGAGEDFPAHPVEVLNLRLGERNLTVPVFDTAHGNIYFGTDLTYPAHVYKIHVGDGTKPMQEEGRLDLKEGTVPFDQLPRDGRPFPKNKSAEHGEIFLRSSVLDVRHDALYFGTDSHPGQIIKIGINGKK